MPVTGVFREVAIATAKKQSQEINALTEESPLYGNMPMMASSHPFTNVYEEINDISGAVVTDVDGALTAMDVKSELKDTNLKVAAGLIEVGEEKARPFGGHQAYFTKKMPGLLARTGNNIEYDLIYNFLRKYAIDNERVVSAGGSGSANYSMICVKWSEDGVIGLFSPTMFGNGKVFEMTAVCNGAPYLDSSKRMVYGLSVKTYLGLQMANPKHISGIVNIDLFNATPKFPSEKQIDDMIIEARGNPSNTVIYCHPKVYSHALKSYKAAQVQVAPAENDPFRGFAKWDGIPIVTSWNFKNGDEGTVSL